MAELVSTLSFSLSKESILNKLQQRVVTFTAKVQLNIMA
jgi:hypothetical protein